jgi:hypothetical protein
MIPERELPGRLGFLNRVNWYSFLYDEDINDVMIALILHGPVDSTLEHSAQSLGCPV